MKVEYDAAPDLEKLAEQVIKQKEELHMLSEYGIRIAFVRCSKRNQSKYKTVYADTRVIKGVYSLFIPYDFIIIFYAHAELLNDKQLEILMWHELMHCGVDEKGQCYLYPHSIEDFAVILEQYGLDWNECE